ncbi:HAMP domain-containing protein [Candidatus Symbiopectobacterium sp. NZEC127]|uniref:methyl-accepting chemotaxis protein n=1 Tax=Candidatus Symbiopectobacterium sp. NZEC127 TaxID=2820472 RepID=UPI002225F460|nr:methyl-accepting chemotaxis protein [Candidatus Symbiopectobacterium sp. NZEC127]MCW2487180.1 HAMP domain-containing protein [Candidatus Symbiopectobacterium sp. NZEC127]
MNIANWRIGYRLGSGFAFLVLMLFVVNAFSISKLSLFHEDAKLIVTRVYPDTVTTTDLIDVVNSTLVAYQRLLLVTDPAQVKSTLEMLGDLRKRGGQLLDKLVASNSPEASQQIIRDIQQIRPQFLASGDKIIASLNAGDREAGVREFTTAMNDIQRNYREQVRKLVAFQNGTMSKTLDTMTATYNQTRLLLVLICLAAAAAGGMIAWLITRSVTRPIHQALELADRVAQGDLTYHVQAVHQDETGLLLKALDNMNSSLRHIVGQVRDGAEAISTAASQIAAGNQDLSARTEEQASSLEQTASSMEELTSTIKNTADNTRQATSVSHQASDAAKNSSEVMLSVTQKMRGIQSSSQRMAEIIGVIDSIAFQTNILALNAAVEAARAGEQGRGFAVVASEVRSLAQRSATAAKEIKTLIDDSVSNIQDGMNLVDSADETLGRLTNHVQDVNAIIAEISQASQEQSDGVSQINVAVGQIDTTTQQNAALVEESAAAAMSLQSQASALTHTVSAFKLNAGETVATPLTARESTVTRPAKPTLALATGTSAQNNQDWTSF